MTRSKLKQPNYSLSDRDTGDASKESSEKLERCCAWRRYERGEPIVDYLDASDDVFFVASGNVRVTIYSVAGKAVSFNDLGLGISVNFCVANRALLRLCCRALCGRFARLRIQHAGG
jgi:CRP-like cAMP-binding protein